MKKEPLILPCILALFAVFFGSAFFTQFPLLAFSPLLAIIFMRSTFLFSLWGAALCGLTLDFLSAELRFGWQTLIYTLTVLIAYPQKKHFFDDKPFALSLYAILISSLISFQQLLFLCFLKKDFTFSPSLLITDLLIMPMLDGVYALIWFTLPIKIYQWIRAFDWHSLLFKKDQE